MVWVWKSVKHESPTVLTLVQVYEHLGLSYHSLQQLNNIIESSLPEIPKFQQEPVVMGGKVFEMYSRNIINCIKYLFGDPEFVLHLLLTPKHHFADTAKINKAVHEMNSCCWWWNTQVRIWSPKSFKHTNYYSRWQLKTICQVQQLYQGSSHLIRPSSLILAGK